MADLSGIAKLVGIVSGSLMIVAACYKVAAWTFAWIRGNCSWAMPVIEQSPPLWGRRERRRF
jgi:hypothetical protein